MTGERLPDETTAVEPTAEPAVEPEPEQPTAEASAGPVAEAAEPATSEPATSEPATSEPAAEPATAVAETADPAAAEPATAETAEPAAAPVPAAEPLLPRERFARARRIGRRVRPIVQIGLFVAGIALGYTVFQASRPIVAPESVPVADVNATTAIPPAVRDLVGALRSDDQSAVRAVLDSEPYRLLAGELASMNFQKIDGVDTLSTFTHDNLAATEIVVRGENADGSLVAINLVVHQKDNVIVSFR